MEKSEDMKVLDCIIVGAGPCGLSTAIELKKEGIESVIIEKGNIVQTIYDYPTHQTFFSSSEKLEIGDIAFITDKVKPVRLDALAYYRSVVRRHDLKINHFEKVEAVEHLASGLFQIHTKTKKGRAEIYLSKQIVFATGYYNQPNELEAIGANLSHVTHYFKEGHPYYDMDVVIIGGKNSAVDAALELQKSGAHVTVLYRGLTYSESIKPWILPEVERLVNQKEIRFEFESIVTEITKNRVVYTQAGEEKQVDAAQVFAMIGYQPDTSLLTNIGVKVSKETGIPTHNKSTYETNIPNIYIAGVIAAGYNNNEIFIENGRFHGVAIAKNISENLEL